MKNILISKENLKSILSQFKISIFKSIEDFIEYKVMKQEIYDNDGDGIVDKSKISENIEDIDKEKLIKIINAISKTNPQQYLGTDLNNKLGCHYFPINQATHNSIEQKVSLNVKKGDIIFIESISDMQEQKAFVQVYKYIEGEENVIATLKKFNNTCKENFIYTNNIEFDDSCHIKNKYLYNTALVDGVYQTDIINKNEFLSINAIE